MSTKGQKELIEAANLCTLAELRSNELYNTVSREATIKCTLICEGCNITFSLLEVEDKYDRQHTVLSPKQAIPDIAQQNCIFVNSQDTPINKISE